MGKAPEQNRTETELIKLDRFIKQKTTRMIFSRKALTTLTVAATLLSVNAVRRKRAAETANDRNAASEARRVWMNDTLEWLETMGTTATKDPAGWWSFKALNEATALFGKYKNDFRKAVLTMRFTNFKQEYQNARKECDSFYSVARGKDHQYSDEENKKIDDRDAAWIKFLAFKTQYPDIKG